MANAPKRTQQLSLCGTTSGPGAGDLIKTSVKKSKRLHFVLQFHTYLSSAVGSHREELAKPQMKKQQPLCAAGGAALQADGRRARGGGHAGCTDILSLAQAKATAAGAFITSFYSSL